MEKMTIEEISKYLHEHKLYAEDISSPLGLNTNGGMENAVFDITIEGDWKHDHLYLDCLMEQKDYYLVSNNEIYVEEYEGSDFYKAVHRYAYKPFWEMVNGKYKKKFNEEA